MKAIQLSKTGPPSVLSSSIRHNLPIPSPSANSPLPQYLVSLKYASVNFIDTYQRTGLYPMQMPVILGSDGSGIVEKVFDGETSDSSHGYPQFHAGDRVAVFKRGTYAEYICCSPKEMVRVPKEIPLDVACALMINGLTAHYLATDCAPIGDASAKKSKSQTCLIHAVAGGTGQLLAQIAKRVYGAQTVIGTCSTAKRAFVEDPQGPLHGCIDHLIDYQEHENFQDEVMRITNGRGVDVVYDGVGAATFQKSLQSLRRRGTMVSFGNASGAVSQFNLLDLSKGGSLFVTRPTLADYIAEPGELAQRASELFQWLEEDKIRVTIQKHYNLEEAEQAHKDLEARKSHGKFILDIQKE